MGNNPIENRLQVEFIQAIEDEHFGDISIFRSQDGKFLMKQMRTYVVDDKRYIDFVRQLQCTEKVKHRCIAPILYIQRKKNKNICIDYESAEIYTQYFNFTLYDMIKANKEMNQSELWLCLKQLITLSQNLQNENYMTSFDIDNIFITLKGFPLIYPIFMDIKQFQKVKRYQMRQDIVNCIMKLMTNELFLNSSAIKQKVKQISPRLSNILQQISQNQSLTYQQILNKITSLENNKQITIASEIKLNKFRYIIPASIDDVRSSQFSSALPSYRPINNKMNPSATTQDKKNSLKSRVIQENQKDQKDQIFDNIERKKNESQMMMEKLIQRKQIMRGKTSSNKQNVTTSSLKNSKIKQSNKKESFTKKAILSQCKVKATINKY